MCGIAGILDADGVTVEQLAPMAGAMAHRGPDAAGCESTGPVGMAATRLALLDLSPAGNQPMAAGHCLLAYNGEIYNHAELRSRLPREAGEVGRSDTAVLFAHLRAFGLDVTLPLLKGMFAFSWWDGDRLHLVRDRYGIKPLSWTSTDGRTVWGSEVKVMATVSALRPDPTRALFALLGHADRSPGRSPFAGVHQVPPGHVVTVERTGATRSRAYHDLLDEIDEETHRALGALGHSEVVDRLDELISSATRGMVEADAPMGTFVSGGVDSSLLAALACATDPDHALFAADVAGTSELDAAAAVATRLGREVQSAPVPNDARLADWAAATWSCEAPVVTHMNALPLGRVAHRARAAGVKGVLTGEGADELFLGYSEFGFARYRAPLRLPLRALVAAYGTIPPLALRTLPELVERRAEEVAGAAQDFEEERARLAATERYAFLSPRRARAEAQSACYMGGHLLSLLQRNDRMGMQASIECRFPFLDDEVVAFGLNLPVRHKLRLAARVHDRKHPFVVDKAPVRAVAARHVSRATARRPKDGFPAPGHRGLVVDPALLDGGWAASALGLSSAGIEHLVDNHSLMAARMVSVEVFGRLFGVGDDVGTITGDLVRHVRDAT